MSSCFQFVHPGLSNRAESGLVIRGGKESAEDDAVLRAMDLADSAGAFFSGVYPTEAPYFWWGESLSLPWHNEYWKPVKFSKRPGTTKVLPFEAEAEHIALILTNTATSNDLERPWRQVTHLAPELASPKLKMQGLAVETMLDVDGFLVCILSEEFESAMEWLAAANANIMECMLHAQKILGSVSENARAAAQLRHTENRAMKTDVWAWLDANFEITRSLDATASDLHALRLVPVTWRTIRTWISEWKKLRSAGTP